MGLVCLKVPFPTMHSSFLCYSHNKEKHSSVIKWVTVGHGHSSKIPSLGQSILGYRISKAIYLCFTATKKVGDKHLWKTYYEVELTDARYPGE